MELLSAFARIATMTLDPSLRHSFTPHSQKTGNRGPASQGATVSFGGTIVGQSGLRLEDQKMGRGNGLRWQPWSRRLETYAPLLSRCIVGRGLQRVLRISRHFYSDGRPL